MAAPPVTSAEVVESKDQLVAWFASGEKPPAAFRIGTEHEKFVYHRADLSPAAYEGETGVRALLERMACPDWELVAEDGRPIALAGRNACAGGSVTLEPGGQLELSGAPVETLHETCAEAARHLRHVKQAAQPLDLGVVGLGFHPTLPRDAAPWMPKGRYRIMRDYMPKRGALGLDMMLRTCTIQTNLDFSSEADMRLKLRAALALQPAATALFANSPFTEGRPNGFQSYRSWIWTDTDPDRCGAPEAVFEDGFGYERHVDWLLDVPMYFVFRDGRYIDAAGQSFRDFLAGRLPALPGEKPRISDFADHATTVFPEARLKKYIEMRGADGGPWSRICALPAFWVGLMYDAPTLHAAWDLVKTWTMDDHRALRLSTPRLGLRAPIPGGRLMLDLCRDLVALAGQGLRARARRDAGGEDETGFLADLRAIAESGRSPADEQLELFHGPWGGHVDPIFRAFAY